MKVDLFRNGFNKKAIFVKQWKSYVVLFFLAAILFYGTYLRIESLDKEEYWLDEGFSVSQALAISDHGFPLLDSGKIDFKDCFYGYFIAGMIKTFGMKEVPLRLTSVVFGAFSIFLIYIIGLKMAGSATGLLASFFIAFSYWHIAWSRQIRGYSMLVFLVLFGILFLLFYKDTGKRRYAILAFLSMVMAALTKTVGMLLIFSLLLFFLFSKKKKVFQFILFLALSIFAIGYPFLAEKFRIILVDNSAYYFEGYFWKYLGIFSILSAVGLIFALWKDRENRPIHIFILSFCFFGIIVFCFFEYVAQFRYMFVFSTFVLLYAAYLVNYLSEFFRPKLWAFILFAVCIVAVDYFFPSIKPVLSFLPKHGYYPLEEYTPQPKFSEAYEYSRNNMENGDFLLSAYPFMDRIYLGKPDYALAISYTGSERDLSVTEDRREFYSGSQEIYSNNRIIEMTKLGNVYVIMDDMALSRTDPKIRNFIHFNAPTPFLVTRNIPGQNIYVYSIAKNTRFFEENPAVTDTDVEDDDVQDFSDDGMPGEDNEDIVIESPDSNDDGIEVEFSDEDVIEIAE